MSGVGTTAMVLAAGVGVRMRPLTNTRPKPLVEIKGKPLIEFGFDRLRAAGVNKAVVNVHYLPEQIEAWAKRQTSPRIEISSEREQLLDTGGGIAHALPLLGETPFFVINSDSFWIDGTVPALERLRRNWDDDTMDCILLLCPRERTLGYGGTGDFILADDGRLSRPPAGTVALVYIGAYLVHPRLFQGAPPGKFSMNLLWDQAIHKGRLFGISHTGRWVHVGTPDAIGEAESALLE
ncbi:MAG: nucleotidyltransferase family protein [Rhizobiales bacterium]|nr:nucleotidyltransferase family protein [Hyphomicrobiales bacterium]